MYLRSYFLTLTAILAVLSLTQVGWSAEYGALLQPDNVRAAAYNNECGSAVDIEGCSSNCGGCGALVIYGDYLYLRPRNAGVEYAVPINSSISPPGSVPIQVGRTATLNPQFESGFRVGGAIGFDHCTTIGVGFTHYENNVNDAITTSAPYVIRAMVLHPSSADAEADWLDASARGYIRFNLADIDYRHVFYVTESSSINYLVGLRYANLNQTFHSQFQSIIQETVDTDVNFDGWGIRLGLEAERVGWHNMFVYGKAYASFLGGEFRGNYLQGSTNDPLIVQTDWKEARLVSMLDCEIGLGWTSCNNRVRVSAGYMVSGWLNVVKTSEFISAVQANQYHGPEKIDGNGLVFDGLVLHTELRW